MYPLEGNQFCGYCGNNSIAIFADGKLLQKLPIPKEGKPRDFIVDVTGVEQLKIDTMTVCYNEITEEYSLIGDKWMDKPNSYIFANLLGKVDANTFSGTVDVGSKSTFSVQKID